MSSKILISIPCKGQENKYKTYLGLLDSGASASLADENLFKSSLVTKREGRGSTWKTQVGNVSTSKVASSIHKKPKGRRNIPPVQQANQRQLLIHLGKGPLSEYRSRRPQLSKRIPLGRYSSKYGAKETLDPSSHQRIMGSWKQRKKRRVREQRGNTGSQVQEDGSPRDCKFTQAPNLWRTRTRPRSPKEIRSSLPRNKR